MPAKVRCSAVLGVVILLSGIFVASGASSAGAATVQGISGTTIKVGGVYDSSAFSGAAAGFEARIDRANRTHELGKYTIDDIGSTDVGSNVNQTETAVQNLVERQGVFAVAPVVTTGLQQNTATYLTGKHVPFFGAGFTNAYCSPNTYGISPIACAVGGKYAYTTAVANMASAVSKALGKPVDKLRWAFVGFASPDGQNAVNVYVKQVQGSKDGTVVYAKGVIPQTSGGDIQPIVTGVMQTHPDIAFSLAGPSGLPFSVGMKQAGYKGALADPNFYAPGLLQEAPSLGQALQGEYVQTTSPTVEENLAFAKQMKKDYVAIGNPPITFGGELAYQSADLMIAALKKAAPNFGSVVPTFEHGFSYKPLKGASPLTWPAAYNQAGACGGTVRIVGTEYKVVTPFNCNGKRVKVG